ncbi:hypothetical protein BH10ACT1_BH10ACT1_30310 [soil metagenome]
MDRRRTPFRRARLAGVALLVVATATACNGGPVGRTPAATVNGHDITLDQVRDLMDAQQRFYTGQKKQAAAGADTSALDGLLGDLSGTGSGTLGTKGAAAALSQLITYQAVIDDLARDGVKVTAADRKTVRDGIVQQVGSEAELKKLDKEFVDFTIKTQAATLALQKQVEKTQPAEDREKQVQALYDQTKTATPLCLNLILAKDAAAATEALDRVKGGEDFAAVAQELSQDPTTAAQGGFAGCATPETATQTFPTDFTDVAVGDLLGPITVENGPVVIQVDSITGPELEQVRSQIEAQLDQEGSATDAAVTARIDKLLSRADVHVDERYGTWDAKTAAVVPPTDPGASSTASTTAPATGAPAGS